LTEAWVTASTESPMLQVFVAASILPVYGDAAVRHPGEPWLPLDGEGGIDCGYRVAGAMAGSLRADPLMVAVAGRSELTVLHVERTSNSSR
jgi:hypothetical protein